MVVKRSRGLISSPAVPPGVPWDYSSYQAAFFHSSCPCWAQVTLFSSLSPSASQVVTAFSGWWSQVPHHPGCFPDSTHKIPSLEPLPSRNLPPPLLRACLHSLPDTLVTPGRGVVGTVVCPPDLLCRAAVFVLQWLGVFAADTALS